MKTTKRPTLLTQVNYGIIFMHAYETNLERYDSPQDPANTNEVTRAQKENKRVHICPPFKFHFTKICMENIQKQHIANKKGPVLIIEDDADDQEILTMVFQKLNYPNKILFFFDGQDALDHINSSAEPPFLILSDINMPRLTGFQLRAKLKTDARLSNKCIPYLFFSTALNQQTVIDAYSQSVQGFFVKQSSIDEIEKTISAIMEYWRRCAAPNDFSH